MFSSDSDDSDLEALIQLFDWATDNEQEEKPYVSSSIQTM